MSRHRLAGIVCLALVVAACHHRSGPQHTDPEAFSWSGPIPPGGTLRIHDINGSIDVRPSTDGTVKLTAETRWHRGNPKREITFQAVPGDKDVTICAIWGTGTCSATQYNSNSKHSFGGMFSSSDVEVDFTAYVPAGVKVDAGTINGSIAVTATAPVHARTINGGIKVGTSVGPVDAETISGDVDVRMTTLGEGGPVRAVSMNGTVSAFLPTKLDAQVKLETLDGRVGTDFPLTVSPGAQETSRTKLNGVVGAGGREIEIHSMNGSAWLRRLNADGTVAAASNPVTSP